jgi:Tfp pilus assembly pilus retraction ATPase PilT
MERSEPMGATGDLALPGWLSTLLETAAPHALILKAGDPPFVVTNGSVRHLSTVALTRLAMEALARDILPHDGRNRLAAAGSMKWVLRGPEATVELRADQLDDQLVVRLRRLEVAEPRTPAANETADLVAALGAAARTGEVEAAIDALRHRLHIGKERAAGDHTTADASLDARTPARVLGLHRRREVAVDRFSFDDWVAEGLARGARTLYLPAGGAPFMRIDGQVTALASQPLPLAMFEQMAAAMTAERDGWRRTAQEWEWSRHRPAIGTIHCQVFSDARGGGLVVHLPATEPFAPVHLIPAHIRLACEAGDGLIVLAAPFAADVSAMVESVVAWRAKVDQGYFIVFGNGVGVERLGDRVVVSERPLPDSHQLMAAAIDRAVRERPDLLVVSAGNNHVPASEAIVGAAVGRLVIVGVVARTAPRALGLISRELVSSEARNALAEVFAGGCSWRRIRRPGGSVIVCSDVLIGTDRVAALIRDGDIDGLDRVQRLGQDGARTVEAVLARAVARKKITLREAAASAVDRQALIGLVRRMTREIRRGDSRVFSERPSGRRPATRA